LLVAATDRHSMVLAFVEQQHERVSLVASRTKLRNLVAQFRHGEISDQAMRDGTRPILEDARRSTDGFRSIWIVDPDGRVMTSTDDSRLGQDVSGDEAFQAGLTGGHLGEPTLSHGEHLTAVAAPAKTNDGELLGVVMVELDVARLFKILTDTRGLGETGEVLVGTQDGENVRYLFPSKAGTKLTLPARDAGALVTAVDGAAKAEVTTYAGVDVLVYSLPIEYQPQNYRRWGLIAKINVKEAYQPLEDLRRWRLYVQVVVLMIGLGGSFWLSRKLTSPVRQLTDTAMAVASGDLTAKVLVNTHDEIGLLGRTFNAMTQELQMSYATLERRVEERTLELDEKARQLEKQRQTAVTLAEELKKADQAKNEFLANMSHEIRTPMNAVMGLTELVLGSQLDDIQRDYLTTVMDSAESLLAVINDILDFSKIEAGMLKFEEVEFQLYDTVGDTVRTQALRAQRKGLELVCFIDPAIPFSLKGDPGRLRQVLMNLIGNAIKFTQAGEVVVRVEKKADADGQLMLNFSVSDTGIGIAQDKLVSIFEPFEQADTSTTREFGGTGLGLAICHKLVSLMGGQIDVDSEPGRGSTFRFTVTFAVSDTQSRPATIPEELKGMRVLVIDDNGTNRTILEQVLLAKEMVPVTAPSAFDGITLLQEAVRDGRPYRLLIFDVHMPKLDGFGFVEMIRADASLSALDIILLTSAGQQGDQQRCEDLRIDAQLTKPVKQSELYNIVLRVLGFDTPDDGWLSIHEPVNGELPALRILLVEDSLANQKVALAMLAGAGHTTVVANNGQEALDILATLDFDVILMDVQMPVMDGLEATAAIRAGETGIHDHQPIVAMTAHAMSGDRDRCLAAGMDEYVSKPVYRKSLFKAIAAAIGFEATGTSNSRIVNSTGTLKADASPKLVDWTGPLSQLSGDHAVLKDITESYIKEIHENLSRLPEAIAAGDAQELQRLAHTVKGAMRFFRSDAAQQCGQNLENKAATGDLSTAAELLERLVTEVKKVVPVLQRFVDSGEM
jgi:signal transduction histidine kinase/CheY-like chemotaxis protein/HPt (histidine-containing phosphotransfer) domain-containing protein